MVKNYLHFNVVTNYKKLFNLFLIGLLFGLFQQNIAVAQINQDFTTPGTTTWTVPTGVNSVTIHCIGGGGAGGSGRNNNNQGAGGGAGGQYASSTIAVTPSQVYTVKVADITPGANSNNTDGNQGDFSSFSFGATIHARAMGGNGGIRANGTRAGGVGNTTNGIGNIIVRPGGNGGNGTASESGGGGGGAGSTGPGGNATGTTAGTGTANFGGNGGAGLSASGSGNPGFNYGGGGSGARRNNTGGNGAQGFVRLTYTCPANAPSAGSNQTLAACATTTTLAGSAIPAGMTGLWTVVSGTATITTPTSPTSGVTGLALGATATLRWTVTNGACGSANATVTITTAVGPGCLSYCTSGATSSVDSMISNVTFNTINNTTSNCATYSDFTAISTSVVKGSSYNLTIAKNDCNGGTNFSGRFSAWIDYNQNGTFEAGELVLNDAAASVGPITVSVAIPMGANNGNTRMRCVFNEGTTAPSACGTYTWGETEDYTINIVAPAPCTTPTAQPTALNLIPAGTTIAGNFTTASPAADSYLVVISTSATPPTAPVNGTTYAIGSSLASGYIVVDNDTNTTFTAGGLNNNTTYYFYIFSYNGLCTGGPMYNSTSPLTGNTTTTAAVPTYCTPSSTNSSVYISSLRSVGTINDVTNGPTAYSPGGYSDYTATTIATQIAGGGVNLEIIVTGSYSPGPPHPVDCPSTSQFIKTWVDWNKDGDFDDAGEQVYVSGTDLAPVATALDNIYGFVIPPGTFPGNYRMRVRTRAFCDSGTVNPCGAHTTGETEDYTLAVVEDCPSKILSVTGGSACGPTNTVTLNATKSTLATHFRWYANLTGGAPLAQTTTGTWTTPSISTTTTYYVSAWDGVCETIHRTPVIATILPTTNITVTPSVPEVCGEGNVVQISATGDFVTETLLLQDFETGMAPFTVNTPTNINPGADTPWSVKTSVYVPAATTVWRPALNSGAVGTTGNHFAFTTSDYSNSNIQTIMTSPAIDASLYTSLSLTFDQMYGAFSGDTAVVEAFDGATWNTIATYTGTDIGTPSVFTKMPAIDLSAYAGIPNLQIRFVYTAQWDDGWAIDNIKIEGVRPLNTTFTWTGGTVDAFTDIACNFPYAGQSVTTVYVRPTAMQLASPSWSFTANATLGNGCPVSQLITINNRTKLWKGTSDNNWYNPNNWEPVGVPDANTCVFIYPGSPASNTSNINTVANDAFARSVTVRPSGVLNIHPLNDLTVTNAVTVDAGGVFHIENSGSLIQINNVANTGSLTMDRNAVTNSYLDYVYWSTPVAGFVVNNITPSSNHRYYWIPTVANGGTYAGDFGNWTTASGAMTTGRGYIIRGSSGISTFDGVPNNGNITTPISRSDYSGAAYPGPTSTLVTDEDDNWNLLGNPYPSAISADAFLAANTTNLLPFVKIWTHGIDPSAATADPFYQDFVLNYSVADYITYNGVGSTAPLFDGYIGAGQGFFTSMRHTSPTMTSNAVFDNSMRSNTYRNDQFFRSTSAPIEKHRIWMKLIAPSGASNDALLGYVTNASNDLDDEFDAFSGRLKATFEIYSVINNDTYAIQGRALPFDENDIVPLGVVVPQSGIYTIALSKVDGLFETGQAIYLEDLQLGIIHDIKSAPYTFSTSNGRFENRFVLRYTTNALNENDFEVNNAVFVYTNDFINISSKKETIKEVVIHDLLGRVIYTNRNVNGNELSVQSVTKSQSGLLINVTLTNGTSKTFKVIY